MDPHVEFDKALTRLKEEDQAYLQLWNAWYRLRMGEQQRIVSLLEPPARSAQQIVDDCIALAHAMAKQDGWVLAEHFDFQRARDPRGSLWWSRAVLAIEVLQNTSVDDALTELEASGPLKLYLLVRADIDPAMAWHSCTVAATSIEHALSVCGFEDEEDVDHVTKIGIAGPDVEPGIVLSQRD